MLWDLYQQIRIGQLDRRIGTIEGAPTADGLARNEVVRLEEKLDKLALITRAMFELLGEATGNPEERLAAKVVEIDLRDGQADGRMSPKPKRCPKCDAMMSPRFGRCLFCGHRDETVGSFT
jgi:hypothetical protein